MNCELSVVGERDGKWLYQCRHCHKELRSRKDNPAKIKMACGTADKPKRGPCVYLGEEVRREQCQSCGGKVMVKVMACAVFGECTIGKIMPGLSCCSGCPQWVTADSSAASGS